MSMAISNYNLTYYFSRRLLHFVRKDRRIKGGMRPALAKNETKTTWRKI
jgi:hypothetical protein